MVFPIAVGTGPTHTSSRPFPHSISSQLQNQNNNNEDEPRSGGKDDVHMQGDYNNDVIMTIGTNADETLNATVFISYHFLPINNKPPPTNNDTDTLDNEERRNTHLGPGDNGPKSIEMGDLNINKNSTQLSNSALDIHLEENLDDDEFNVIAELRVQITPTTSPFVSNINAISGRETKSRVPLGIMRKRRSENSTTEYCAANASVEFSSNESHLACLIPLPTGYLLVSTFDNNDNAYPTSIMVIFRIQAKNISPRQQIHHDKLHNLPKLPDYIVENAMDRDNKDDIENDNIHVKSDNHETSGMSSHDDLQDESANASARGHSISYVAHEPKIVRASSQHLCNGQLVGENASITKPNGSFLRQLSGGSSATSNSHVQPPTLQCATCMCTVPFDHYRGKSSAGVSLLLVGTNGGKLLLVDFSLARVQSIALKPLHDNCTNSPIVHISQCTPTQWKPLDIYGEEQGSESKGRIATILRDGSVNIYTTSFVASYNDNGTYGVKNIDHGNISNGAKKYARLQMKIELLSTYHAPMSRLRYVHAKWISPVFLVLLTRSPYLDDDTSSKERRKSMHVMQSETIVAQVWTTAEIMNEKDAIEPLQHVNGWEAAAIDVGANIALISELKLPCGDSFDELVHDTFSLSPVNSESGGSASSVCSECTLGMSISYHRGTDCLAINSQVVTCPSGKSDATKVRPFCLIWDWKRNVPGLTLASSKSYCLYQQQNNAQRVTPIFSWFQLGEDENHGFCAIHVHEQVLPAGKKHRAKKNIYSLSTLSPLNVSALEGHHLSVVEPSVLLLHQDSVTFPVLSKPKTAHNVSLQWDEVRVPPSYVAYNGPCRIAAIGKDRGRSIAVASSRGLCVLDLSRMKHLESDQASSVILHKTPRWKLFSNINDEQRFRIVSMSWWECGVEDFLLAVVQYTNIESLHLVCWSRKSLGFGKSQLLKESSEGRQEENSDGSYGVALPHGFRIQSMSIVKDPADEALPSNHSNPSNRALLLLSYVSCHEGTGSCLKYAVYQLQAAIQPLNGKYELVLARNVSCGIIPLQLGKSPDLSATEAVTGTFLAGGSFLFDLNREVDERHPASSHDAIAVIGIVTVFQGLVAVCVGQNGPTLYRPSLLEKSTTIDESSLGQRKGLIVSYWMSDTISSKNGCRIAWNIAGNDGKVYCWSVPCNNKDSSHFNLSSVERKCDSQHLPGLEKHSIIGEICRLGRSSLWMNGATTSEREIALGPFCQSTFGCTLYAGQRSRKSLSRSDAEGLNSFHVSNCTVAPPQFTPLLFISFLSLSPSNENGEGHDGLAREHIKSTLHRVNRLGSSSSALRIITMKVIELLSQSKDVSELHKDNGGQDNVNEKTLLHMQKWTAGKAILAELVSVVKEIYDPLGFATFFLSVGRQLEPHQFNLIFPLPTEIQTPDSPPPIRTPEDLFSVSYEHGSLATAVSALPLFSCHEISQQIVAKLICHCLIKIEENFKLCSSHTSLTSGEDELFLHQLFWFGVKLEDALEIENSYAEMDDDDDDHSSSQGTSSSGLSQSSQLSLSTTNYEESSIDEDSDDFVSVSASVETDTDADYTTYSSEESHEASFLTPCRTPNKKKKPRVGLVKKVVKKLFPSTNQTDNNAPSLEESAIHDAASSFILSVFDDVKSPPRTPLPVAEQTENDVIPEPDQINDDKLPTEKEDELCDTVKPVTVAGTVCLFLHHIIDPFAGEHIKNHGWKVASVVSHLLQGDRETAAITSAASGNALCISRILSYEDFQATSKVKGDTIHKDEAYEIIANYLVNLTNNCRQQINSQAFGCVLNLILLLLLRFNACHDVQICKGTLIAVGIVSGHLSGRISEIVDPSDTTSDVYAIYSIYATKLNA